MFKFIKETFIAPLKAGWEEARQEQEEEKLALAKEQIQIAETITQIPYNEQMGLALAAPFRANTLGHYFSLFASDENAPKNLILNMYKLGVVNTTEIKTLADLLDRDFEITNESSFVGAIVTFLHLIMVDSIYDKPDILALFTEGFADNNFTKGQLAFLVSVFSYMTTSCIEVSIITKEQGLKYLDFLIAFSKNNFIDWKDFGDNFLAGEKELAINNFIGHKVLANIVHNLSNDVGSPWNNIVWAKK